MKWHDTVNAVLTALAADSALTTALGTDADGQIPIYPANANAPVTYPSIRYSLVFSRESEMLNPMMVQFDILTRGEAKNRTIQNRLYAVLHSETRRTFNSGDCLTQYDDSRAIQHPDAGIMHYAMDFRFEPVRDR